MNNIVKSLLPVFCLLSSYFPAQGQTLTLDSAYSLARQNYPLLQQRDLIARSSAYSLENAAKGYLPQINIAGQATYQSDVTQLPIQVPGVSVLSKDQYKIYAEINQPIYEGGVIKQQKRLQVSNALVEQQKLEVELYKLQERVQQVYFGILLMAEQLKQNELLQNDIQNGIRKTQGALDNGAAFKSSVDLLKAELLKVRQRAIELSANKKAFTDMLGLLTGLPLSDNTTLVLPLPTTGSQDINRPELLLLDYQRNIMDAQNQLLTAKNRPKLNFFAQAGFGRPAFNILSNDFEPYYIGGLRLNVPLSGFYTLKNERHLLQLNRQSLDVQRAVFLFNTQYALRQQNAEVDKLQALIKVDEEIITLRSSVKTTAAVQLENGVITSNDYLREVNAEDAARQTKILHDIQLLMAEYTQKTTAGN
jgi:outer membrane protein TolC